MAPCRWPRLFSGCSPAAARRPKEQTVRVARKADVPAGKSVGTSSSSTPASQVWDGGTPRPLSSSSAGGRLPPAAADRGGQLDPGLCWVKLGGIVPEGLSRWSEPTADIARARPKAGVPAMLRFTPLGPRSVGHARRLCPQEGKKALSSPLPGHGRYARAALGFVVLLLGSPPDLAGVGTEQPRPGCASQLRVPSDVACFWGARDWGCITLAPARNLRGLVRRGREWHVVLLRALFLLLPHGCGQVAVAGRP